MEQKILVIFAVFVALLLAFRLAQRFIAPSSASTPLGFGDPSSHTDEIAPEQQRQMLENTAVLAGQQSATTKKFNTDNFIA